jgi:hypothetical protein
MWQYFCLWIKKNPPITFTQLPTSRDLRGLQFIEMHKWPGIFCTSYGLTVTARHFRVGTPSKLLPSLSSVNV